MVDSRKTRKNWINCECILCDNVDDVGGDVVRFGMSDSKTKKTGEENAETSAWSCNYRKDGKRNEYASIVVVTMDVTCRRCYGNECQRENRKSMAEGELDRWNYMKIAGVSVQEMEDRAL